MGVIDVVGDRGVASPDGKPAAGCRVGTIDVLRESGEALAKTVEEGMGKGQVAGRSVGEGDGVAGAAEEVVDRDRG